MTTTATTAVRRSAGWTRAALVCALAVATLASCAAAQETATPATTSASAATPPLETPDGLAWLTAACGGPAVADASPNSWLPTAAPVVLCMTPPGRVPVLVGVYADPAAASSDIGRIRGSRGYATRTDGEDRTWVFVVEQPDSAPLAPLVRYAFELS